MSGSKQTGSSAVGSCGDTLAGWSKSCWEEQRGSLLIDTAVGHRVEQGEHRMEATLTGEAAVVRFGARSSTCAAGCLALFFKGARRQQCLEEDDAVAASRVPLSRL